MTSARMVWDFDPGIRIDPDSLPDGRTISFIPFLLPENGIPSPHSGQEDAIR